MLSRTPARHARRELPIWLLALALIFIVCLWLITTDDGYRSIASALMAGVPTTLWVSAVAFGLATLIGLALAMMRTSRWRILREMATFYIEIMRGIPVLVFLFYIAFVAGPGLVAFGNAVFSVPISAGWMAPFTIRGFDFAWRAILALSLCYAAFIAEIFRAGIEAVGRGQVEAAHALGLSPWHTFRFIVFPQALRTILPPLGNDFIAMLKDSALVSALGVQDITQIGKVYSSGTFKFFETYTIVAYFYLTMTITLSLMVRWLEQWLQRSHRS